MFIVAKKQGSPDLNMYSCRCIYQQITSHNISLFINISSIQVRIRGFDIYIYEMHITYLISQQLFNTLCVTLMVGLISYRAMSKIKLKIINFQKCLFLVFTTLLCKSCIYGLSILFSFEEKNKSCFKWNYVALSVIKTFYI